MEPICVQSALKVRDCQRHILARVGSPHQARQGSLTHGFPSKCPTELLVSVSAKRPGPGDSGAPKATECKGPHWGKPWRIAAYAKDQSGIDSFSLKLQENPHR